MSQESKPQMSRERREALRAYAERRKNYFQSEKRAGPGGYAWYGSSLSHYEQSFLESFSESNDHPLRDWVERRRKLGKPVVAMDLMSDGQTLRDLKPDRGLAVTLLDHRTSKQRFSDQEIIDLIEGDLLNKRTWQKIQAWVQKYGGVCRAADLIMERGIAPIKHLPKEPKLLALLLNNLYSVLSPDDGMMILQIPTEMYPYAEQLAERLRGNSTIEIIPFESHEEVHVKGIRLVRHPNSPDTLPASF